MGTAGAGNFRIAVDRRSVSVSEWRHGTAHQVRGEVHQVVDDRAQKHHALHLRQSAPANAVHRALCLQFRVGRLGDARALTHQLGRA